MPSVTLTVQRDQLVQAMDGRGRSPNDPLTWGDLLALADAVEAAEGASSSSSPATSPTPSSGGSGGDRIAALERELAELRGR